MALVVVSSGIIQCSMGLSKSVIIGTSNLTAMAEGKPMCSILDFNPLVNIMPFGLCNSFLNPAVAAATAANMGVHTPAPCVPQVKAPWIPTSLKMMVGGAPVLSQESCCICPFGGTISVVYPGQTSYIV